MTFNPELGKTDERQELPFQSRDRHLRIAEDLMRDNTVANAQKAIPHAMLAQAYQLQIIGGILERMSGER